MENISYLFLGLCIALILIHPSVGLSFEELSDSITIAKSHKSYFDVPIRETVGRRKREITYDGTIVNYSEQEKNDILNRHQKLRGQVSPEAANMEYMYWDDDLATMGETWASACIWDHDNGRLENISPYDSFGQNLWLGSGSLGSPPDGVGPVNAWYNEVNVYDYENHACSGVCGHYTQVVWARSIHLGCGRAFCESVTEGGTYSNVWIMACHYSPAGNYQGVRPYISGPSCSFCGSGSGMCSSNLCRNCTRDNVHNCGCGADCKNCGTLNQEECTCSCVDGWYTPDCSKECKNYHENCGKSPGWPSAAVCPAHPSIPENCPLMCGLCNAADGNGNGNGTCDDGGDDGFVPSPAAVSGRVVLEVRFKRDYNKPESDAYQNLATTFANSMDALMTDTYGDRFGKTLVNRFRKCTPRPCTIVDFTLRFHGDPSLDPDVPIEDRNDTAKVVLRTLNDALRTGQLGPLKVKPGEVNLGAPRMYATTKVVTENTKGGFLGEVDITVPVATRGWMVTFNFPRNVNSLRICNAEVVSRENKGRNYRLRNHAWNGRLEEGSTLNLWFWADVFKKIKGGFHADVVFIPIPDEE